MTYFFSLRYAVILILIVSLCGCASSHLSEKSSNNNVTTENNPLIDRHEMLVKIMSLMGVPYASTGTDSTGFDCSGFTLVIYNSVQQFFLPRSCEEQFQTGKSVARDRLQFGDLVFFHSSTSDDVSHVGIYVGDGLFAHASTSIGVTITPLQNAYFKKRYVGARRLVY